MQLNFIGKGWDYNPGKPFLQFDETFAGNFKLPDNQPTFKDYNRPTVKNITHKGPLCQINSHLSMKLGKRISLNY